LFRPFKPPPYSNFRHRLLYDDGKVRLVEVTIRAGETTPMHGHPFPSVMAYNSIAGAASATTDKKPDPSSPLNGQGGSAGHAPSRHNLSAPTCGTSAPEAPHAVHNPGLVPVHYYRIDYKRIDGDGLSEHWQQRYPWMTYLPYMP